MVICVGESGLMGRNHFSVCVCVWRGGGGWGLDWKLLDGGVESPPHPPHLGHSCRLGNHQIFRAYFMAQKIH